VPDKEKCEAFLRAQKNVAEQNTTKALAPTGILRSPSRRKAASVYNPVRRRKILFFILFIISSLF
jgi:hypothetical protein